MPLKNNTNSTLLRKKDHSPNHISLKNALNTRATPHLTALGKGRHCGLARRLIAVCRRAIPVIPEGQRPHPRRSDRRRIGEDAANQNAVREHVKVVVVPFAGWATNRRV
jgi:hypothetical protein